MLAGTTPSGNRQAKKSADAIALPPALLPGGSTDSGAGAPPAGSGASTQTPAGSQAPRQDPSAALLDYLLGGNG